MKKVLILGIMLLLPLNMLTAPGNAAAQKPCITQSEVKFGNEFRRLWVDHVLWTSNYITSATTAGAEDQKQVLARLLKNQEDIGNSIKPYYGDAAGNKLTELLKEHIVIAGDLVEAAKSGQGAKVNQLNKIWHRNADEIAAFLSGANPNLQNEDVKKLLYTHLELVTDDLTASLVKDWDARIVSIDDGLSHIIMMADAISDAVVKQFPNKFKG
ncbi:glycosyltransferase [Cytobacillus oceanisediminis]|uniref:glycosyltransferase n=1 Tax=Cytobacillus oceanisediminis TaxID=665099 RepID=UPI001C2419FA|nr:glycosyltransferase [Cytobacillus oceanisediminis]MBU8772555.1 glycosyltransferase [Cytobacillus oceanisediminis]